VQKQIVKTISKTPIRAPTHMIMTVIRLVCLLLLGSSLNLGTLCAVDGEALGAIVNAGAGAGADGLNHVKLKIIIPDQHRINPNCMLTK